ncbi:MAG: hypothetical protein CMC15_12095 [Flavobacteriaceae bacterium]|nr:hypothetical protein [Flavobacteriaceae bacterium]MAY52744.1 hypothetical protein [Flavobacteriaceae bacterium]
MLIVKFKLSLFLFLLSLAAVGQDLSYYKQVADTAQNPTIRLQALDSVLSKSFRVDNDVFVTYSEAYITLAKEIDIIEAAARKAMNLQYILTNVKSEPRRAVTVINSVLAEKYQIKDSFLLGGLYLKRGGAHFRLDLQKAIDDYTLAIKNFGQKDSVYVADALLFRGQAYSTMGKFVPAGENYDRAYRYFEALEDYQYMAHAQQGNITMFSMNGFYDKAKEERDKLILKLKELGLNEFISVEQYNQGLDYRKQGKTDLAIKSFLEAKENTLSKDLKDPTYNSIIAAIVTHYSERGNYGQATEYLNILEANPTKYENDPYGQLSYLGAKARYAYAFDQPQLALTLASKRLNIAQEIGYGEEIMNSHLLLSEIQETVGNYKQSLENKKKYLAKRDSVYNTSSANALAYYQTLYETEKKENELISKSANIKLLEKDNDAFRKLMVFIGVAVLLTFGIILLYRNQLHLKKKKMLQERFSQDLLISQEEERKRISKDLHDGLGQRLLVLKNKLIGSGDIEAKQMVDHTIEEVRSISRDLHPFQLQELGITKAIEHTISEIDENTSLFISSEIENIDNLFTPEQEVNIYRIVQESLSNTLKHANAEASKVSVKKFVDKVIISIRDNGSGFDFSEKYKHIKSLGLKTLLERTKFLNGQMKVQSKKETGTLLEFQFPLS